MRISQVTVFLAVLGLSNGFAPAVFLPKSPGPVLSMAAESHIDKSYMAGSGMNVNDIEMLIKNLDAANYEESLEMLEPLLTNECVGDVCDDYIGMLISKADELGKTVPQGYAKTHH